MKKIKTILQPKFLLKRSNRFLPVSKNETSIVFSYNNSNNQSDENIKNLIRQYNFRYKIKKIKKFNLLIKCFEFKIIL